MREDHSCDVLVVHLETGSVVEDTLYEYSASLNRDWSQSHLVGHVTDGVDASNTGVLELVDLDGTKCDLNCSVGETQGLDIRRSTKGNKA